MSDLILGAKNKSNLAQERTQFKLANVSHKQLVRTFH
jgi:hypothetical protein